MILYRGFHIAIAVPRAHGTMLFDCCTMVWEDLQFSFFMVSCVSFKVVQVLTKDNLHVLKLIGACAIVIPDKVSVKSSSQ